MKNIAIFCDGTWQYLDQAYPTNVALLARCVLARDARSETQVVYYDDGVGVKEGVMGNEAQLFGGALGQGLDHKVAHAYEFLSFNYEPGDRIFIFGFSRGAFTARSLGGLLRWAWILKRENASFAGHAMELYRSQPAAKQADAAGEQAFKDRLAAFRSSYCHPAGVFEAQQDYDPENADTLTPTDPQTCAWVQYIGVWDTVGSLGIPDNLPLANLADAQYGFYDTNLSAFVRSARHAVSIDEKRVTFSPTLWTNIADLNANAPRVGGYATTYEMAPYQQAWFPGGHGSVGGGGADGGISIPPLLWIAEGAARAGLALDRQQLDAYAQLARPEAPFQPDAFSIGSMILKAIGMKDRPGPATFDEVSLSARLRTKRLAYDPPPLRAPDVVRGLASFAPPAEPSWYNP